MKTLITYGLPYANGDLHLGHILEAILADIQTRFLRLKQKPVLFICGSDMHGTPIEVNAQKKNMQPLQFALKNHDKFKANYDKFLISLDHYYHTHSAENEEVAAELFNILVQKNLIYKKSIKALFCSNCSRFLPDRYVKGTCPNCGTHHQYGDICESCGLTIKGTDLLNPYCILCNTNPSLKDSEHYFFKLSAFGDKLLAFYETAGIQQDVRKYVEEWISKGLEDWCISRDAPYFGFKIPGEADKYFYVWFDAPIGYISITKHFCDAHHQNWEEYWKPQSSGHGTIIHNIGKDIVYFHLLFWPAVLMGAGYNVPKDVVIHGHININGEKMSKSRGNFFTAEEFASLYSPEYLRWYVASHFAKSQVDIELNFDDFKAVINNKLIANLGNFCMRVLSFASQNYDGVIKKAPIIDVSSHVVAIEEAYTNCNFKKAADEILAVASVGNKYFQDHAPWKNPEINRSVVESCAELVRKLALLVKPILPTFSSAIEQQLGLSDQTWNDLNRVYEGTIHEPKVVLHKIEKLPSEMTFPADLRVGTIEEVRDHPQAEKLYILQIDFGEFGKRQIIAGIKHWYPQDTLLGKKAVVCVNLKPAVLRGEKSEGMLLAADDGNHVFPLFCEKSKPGEQVRILGYLIGKEQITFDQFMKLKLQVSGGYASWQGHMFHTAEEKIPVPLPDGSSIR